MTRPVSAQSHLRFPLTYLLANEGSVRVLRLLLVHGGHLSVAQLSRESGITLKSVRFVLESLAEQRLVSVFGQARSRLYAVDHQHPLADALKALFTAERSRWENLIAALRAVFRPIEGVEAAWLYGSVARGDDKARSDLDIAVAIGKGKVDALAESIRQALQEVENRHFVTCSLVALSRRDVVRLAQGEEWWKNLAEVAKPIKGTAPATFARKLMAMRR